MTTALASLAATVTNENETTMPEAKDREGGDMLLPSFFVRVIGAMAVVCTVVIIPWGSWVTIAIMDHGYRVTMADKALKHMHDYESRCLRLEGQIQVVEATRFTSQNGRDLVAAIEQRLNKLEDKFDLLRRDIDRAAIGNKP